MRDYLAKHGPIPVIDDFDRVRPLTSRDSMLTALGDHGIQLTDPNSGGGGAVEVKHAICTAPPQVIMHEGVLSSPPHCEDQERGVNALGPLFHTSALVPLNDI